MTVGELIEVLSRLPAHHPVVVEYESDFCCDLGPQSDVVSIDDVRADAIGRNRTPTVIIAAGPHLE